MLCHPPPSWRNDTREGRVYSLAQIEEERKRRDLANHLLFLQCQREGLFPAAPSSSTDPSLSDPQAIRRFVVEDGAWLHYKPTVAEDTILHYLIEKSTIEGVSVALKGTTAPMLDLTITGKVGRTPLHKICDRENPEDTVMLLEVILDALEQRAPGTYLVNWMQEDWDGGLDFLSYAASRWRLSFVWPVLQRRLPRVFAPVGEDIAGRPPPSQLKIKTPVHPRDWEWIPAPERGRLWLCKGFLPSPEQTAALQRLFAPADDTQDDDDPEDDGKAASVCLPHDASEVLRCVRRYADVTAECPGMRESLLSVLLSYPSAVEDERGEERATELAEEEAEKEADDQPVEPFAPRKLIQAHQCLAALLQTPHTLEITPGMLRTVCFHHDPAKAVTVLNLLLDRILVAHPTENKNTLWLNFPDAAASNGLLSALWPVLRARVPFFSNLRKSSLLLRSATWMYDWNALDKEQQEIFRGVLGPATGRGHGREGPSGNRHESPETAALVRLVRSGKLDSAVIRFYVQRGANLNIRESLRLENLFFTILENGCTEAVAAALEASVPIDFTHKGQCGRTILHKLCEMENKKRAVALLKLVVDRIQRCPLDKVDWSQRTDAGAGGPANYQDLDFISMSAACGRLSLFWPVVQDLPFFGDRTTGIPLLADIDERDWAALGMDEQANFQRRRDPIIPLDDVDNMDMNW